MYNMYGQCVPNHLGCEVGREEGALGFEEGCREGWLVGMLGFEVGWVNG